MKRTIPQSLALVLLIAFTASAQTQQETLPDLIRRVKPSVVAIVTYNDKGEALTSGSGFFIRPGQVVTNLHVIDSAHHAEIRTLDGKGKVYPVQGVLDMDEEGDLAILSLDIRQERARAIDLSKTIPEEGESIFVIGNPLRLEGSISDGIVSAVREVPNLGKIIQITAPISHGNSGSPLFNMKGQVVGVVTMKVMNGQNINLALSASRVMELEPGKLMTFNEMAERNKGSGLKSEALAEWWYRNGLNSLWLGNYESALGYFENATNRNPLRAESWIQVGYCKVKQGKSEEAIRAYQKAIRLRPSSAEAHNKLGDAYYYAGRFYDAIASYKQAARLQPRMAEAYYNLGMAYLEIGDRMSAVAQSCLLQPLDATMYRKLLNEIQR